MESNSQNQEVNVWSFVEQHYPNYYSCDDIAENNDLSAYLSDGTENETYKNIREEVTQNHAGWCGTDEEFEELVNSEVKNRLDISNSYIYERAIQNYLLIQNKNASAINDLEGFLETHYEMAAAIEREVDAENPSIMAHYDVHGTAFKWETAKAWTEEFQELHKDRVWDGDWLETVEEFISQKINKL